MWRQYDAFMSWLNGPLSSLWGKLIGGTFSLLMAIVGSYAYDELSQPGSSSLKIDLGNLMRPSSLGMIVLFAVLAYLLLGVLRVFTRRAHRRHVA